MLYVLLQLGIAHEKDGEVRVGSNDEHGRRPRRYRPGRDLLGGGLPQGRVPPVALLAEFIVKSTDHSRGSNMPLMEKKIFNFSKSAVGGLYFN